MTCYSKCSRSMIFGIFHTGTIRQERQTPPHAGSYHPALRERGRAIPSSHIVPKIQDRPDHIKPMTMRPPMGGGGHVVGAPKGNGSLGLLMPLYTIGIIIFFLYTISKVLMGIIMPLYTIGNLVSFLYKALQVYLFTLVLSSFRLIFASYNNNCSLLGFSWVFSNSVIFRSFI